MKEKKQKTRLVLGAEYPFISKEVIEEPKPVIITTPARKHFDPSQIGAVAALYLKQILTDDSNIIDERKKAGLDTYEKMLDHVRLRNKKGVGCGCKLCQLRHKEHIYSLKLKSYQTELSRMGIIEESVLRTKGGKSEYPLKKDPFKHEFFEKHNGIYSNCRASSEITVLSTRVEKSKKHLSKLIKQHTALVNKLKQNREVIALRVRLPL